MADFGKSDVDVTSEQRALLQSRTFSLRPLSTAGDLSFSKLVGLTWHPTIVFSFTLLVLIATDLRYSSPSLDSTVLYLGLTVLLAYPAIAFGLLVVGIVAARLHARVRWSAVLYWTYWPFWKLAMCCIAAALGANLGNYLWYNQFYPHVRYQRLQAYSSIDPASTVGVRLMDAGIVTFDKSAGVDRTRTACLKNGATYCIAPIVKNGTIPLQTEEYQNDDTTYDLFMIGTDCCKCPGEFRCGDWNVPGVTGGMRLLHEQTTEMYRLASQDWAATYKKNVKHPVFFQWTADPLRSYQAMADRGYRIVAMAIMSFPAAAMLFAILLNGTLYLLADSGVLNTLSAPLPQGNVGRMLSRGFLPDIYKNQEEVRSQQQSWMAPDPKYVIL